MRIQSVTLLAVLGLLLVASPASAQFCLGVDEADPDLNSAAACAAATITPFGALSTQLPASWLGRSVTGIGFDVETTSIGSGEETESGTAFALGGGVSFGFASGLSLDVGFKKVTLDEAKSLIGLGLGFQR